MSYENLIYEVNDGICKIQFNRTKALNALNQALLSEFSDALDTINKNEDIRVLILTGAGEKAFVAGADISELAKFNPLQGRQFSKFGQAAFAKIENLSIPSIAAVNGFALGGGLEVAVSCDFIYASEKAKMGLPEITLGLIPGFGGTQRLARIIGKNMASELIYTGKMISANEAKEIGLVNKVCSPESLMDEVTKTAQAIASKGKYSLQAAKRVISSGLDVDILTGCKIEADAFGLCFASEDSKEGTSAFLEKRQANFKGNLV